MKEIIINSFYGGIADSINENSSFKYESTKHFDIYSDPKKLLPITTILANNTGLVVGNRIGNFLSYASFTYALGRLDSAEKAKVFYNFDTNANWLECPTGEATNTGTLNTQTFIEYRGVLYGFRSGGRNIWSYNVATSTFTEIAKDTGAGATITCNGIIGRALGYLYIPQANKIWVFDGSSWTQGNITIPTNETIYGLQNYGNYLAILTSNSLDATSAKSYIYLWDFTSLTPSDVVELPDNAYRVLGTADLQLIAVGMRTTPLGNEMTAVSYVTGSYEPIFNKLYPSTISVVSGVTRSAAGNMYFAVNDSGTGRPYQGIWSIGKAKAGYPFAVSIAYDYIENGGTASDITNFLLVNGVTYTGYGVFISTADFLVHKIGKSPSSAASDYATANPISTFITSKYYADQESALKAVSIKYDALPTAGVATVYYRANDSTTWVQICTDSTDGSLGHIATNIEASGAEFPMFKNIQFKIESLGGTTITDFRFKHEEQNTIYG